LINKDLGVGKTVGKSVGSGVGGNFYLSAKMAKF
jgi:hypothetical protein